MSCNERSIKASQYLQITSYWSISRFLADSWPHNLFDFCIVVARYSTNTIQRVAVMLDCITLLALRYEFLEQWHAFHPIAFCRTPVQWCNISTSASLPHSSDLQDTEAVPNDRKALNTVAAKICKNSENTSSLSEGFLLWILQSRCCWKGHTSCASGPCVVDRTVRYGRDAAIPMRLWNRWVMQGNHGLNWNKNYQIS